MTELILLNVSGADKSGITASLTEILAEHDAKILDIGQADIHHTLSLGMLIKTDSTRSGDILKQLLFKTRDLNVQVNFDLVSEEDYNDWVARQGKNRYIVTVLGREITARQLAEVTKIITLQGLNIETITRLTGRMPLDESQQPLTKGCVEMSVRGNANDLVQMQADFMRLAGQIELRPKEGFFLLPATPEPTPASGRNLMHDTSSGQYILNTLVAGKDTVPMVFDTGNSRTGLSPNYYTLHREEIDRSGKKRETAAGGFGGILRGTGYDLKNITFTIGDGSRTLKKVTVTADFGPASEQPYFGSLGMDLFEKFDRIVFDFGRMFVTAE